jgi:predicted regulator of Ras-like GTPase activity (Roadblock/LC7/MglB family)
VQITKRRKLDRILQGLRRDDPEVINAVLVSPAGLVMAHTFAALRDAEKLAASAAALLAVTNRQKARLAIGAVEKIAVAYADCSLQILHAGAGFLAVQLKRHADEKRFLAYAHAAVADIRQTLSRNERAE